MLLEFLKVARYEKHFEIKVEELSYSPGNLSNFLGNGHCWVQQSQLRNPDAISVIKETFTNKNLPGTY
jgi:hypothetical protein